MHEIRNLTISGCAFLLVFSCGIFGSSSKEEERLSEYFFRAKKYFESGRIPQALDQVERGLELREDDEKLMTLRGFIHLEMAKRDPSWLGEALRDFKKATESGLFHEPSFEAFLGLGLTYQKMGLERRNLATALEKKLKAREVPVNKREATAARIHQLKSKSLEDFKNAEKSLEKVLEKKKNHILASYTIALVKVCLGKKEEALKLLRKYIRAASRRRKQILERDLKQTFSTEREKKLWQELRIITQREKECRGLVANLLYKLKRYKEALEELNKLLEMDPNLVPEYFNRARCHARLGEIEEAKQDYKVFIGRSLLPREDPRIREALEFINKTKTGKD